MEDVVARKIQETHFAIKAVSNTQKQQLTEIKNVQTELRLIDESIEKKIAEA